MISIDRLYGEADNLRQFVHPEYGRTFEFLPDERLVLFAGQMAEGIKESGYRNVIVSETGARPLAYVCERLLEKDGIDVEWKYMKFPRKPGSGMLPLLRFYLSDEEKEQGLPGQQKSREDRLGEICRSMPASALKRERKPLAEILYEVGSRRQDAWQEQTAAALEGTALSGAVGKPFLFFDEYIDSGTTLQNADMYFNFFTSRLDFRTLSYYMNIERSERFDRVFMSLFDKGSMLECYDAGAYPFENRIDLIGYFYCMDKGSYARTTLEGINEKFSAEPQISPAGLIGKIEGAIEKHDLIQAARSNFSVPEVKQFVGRDHIMRQCLFALETEAYGRGAYAEFLWQLADMYGPVWTPMPKENHLDFFRGIEKSEDMIKDMKEFDLLREHYHEARAAVFAQSSEACLKRRNEWMGKINRLLEANTDEN